MRPSGRSHIPDTMRFTEQLAAAWQRNNSLLCGGLDPDPARLPASLTGTGGAIFSFCRAIVDATADLVCAFKPQIAYFASQRAEDQLEQLISYIHEAYPGVPVILDAKRGDIGSTAEHYAKEAFERYQADAVTVSPYMGFDSMQPYLAHADKGVIVLCRTSNAGGSDVQFLETDGRPVYQVVAERARDVWNTSGQMGLVVGATFPEESYLPGTFFEKLESGVFWLDALERGEGLNLVDFSARNFGPGFTIETGMRQEFEKRIEMQKTVVQTAVRVFEQRYA